MRGIVELEVLKAIERELPVNIPVRNFFDLIVGTRFVHMLSLLRLIKSRKIAFMVLWTYSSSVHYLIVFIIQDPETNTVVIVQGGLLHSGLGLKDGPSMSVSTIL